jgi:hypothetical protein
LLFHAEPLQNTEPGAAPNAWRAFRFQSNDLGPAWVRFALAPEQLRDSHHMNIDDKDRVGILLQGQKTATDQMSAIKNYEMSWLKVFLIFYTAVIAWVVGRWFGPATGGTTPATASPGDLTLLWTAMWFSFIGTALFAFLFIHTRHSYYMVKERLHKFDQCLKLYDPAQWDGIVFFPPEHASGRVRAFRDWCKRTKPLSSFLTRLVYIFGANAGIDYLVYLAFEKEGSPQSGYFLAFWFGLNGALAVVVYVYDFVRFRLHETS